MKRSVNSFSDSVGDDEQGWVMGVTTAGRALASGIMSLLGGLLMAVDIRMPFFIAVTAALLGLVFIRTAWNSPTIRRITQ